MGPFARYILLFVVLGCLATLTADGRANDSEHFPRTPPPRADVTASLLNLPLRFEPNRGQFEPHVRFVARGDGYQLVLTEQAATLLLCEDAASAQIARASAHDAHSREQILSMHLVGGRSDVAPLGEEVQSGSTNYFIGDDPKHWKTGIEGYTRVRYPAVLPGVDVVYYGTGQRRVEYDLILAPGTDPASVAVAFDGATAITTDDEGDAWLHLPDGSSIAQPAPRAYQQDDRGRRQHVDARYEVRGGTLGLAVGAFDRARPLIVDPTLVYSTRIGSTAESVGVAVNSAGQTYVVGSTPYGNLPTTSGAFQPAFGGAYDAFVLKLSADGTSLLYATYLGGSSDDYGAAVAVDAAGSAYLAGYSVSKDYPVASAFQPTNAGNVAGVVTKLSPDGSSLVYSTYLVGDGSNDDQAMAIAVDASGEAFVAGLTESPQFPTASTLPGTPAQGTFGGGQEDAFVAKFSATGSSLVYSTFLGGSGTDYALGIAIDSAGDAFVTGSTSSTDFPTTSPLQGASGGGADAFVAKVNPSGTAFPFSTYLGGTSNEIGYAIALDSSNAPVVVGETDSSNFPTTSPLQPASGGGSGDAFVSKLNASGSTIVFSTYLGGSNWEQARGVALDAADNIYVVGSTESGNFPMAAPLQGYLAGTENAFITKLRPSGAALAYSTYLGGGTQDVAYAVAVDEVGNAFVAGGAYSFNFPTTSVIQQSSDSNPAAAFVAKISPAVVAAPALGRYAWLLWFCLALMGIAIHRARSRLGSHPE